MSDKGERDEIDQLFMGDNEYQRRISKRDKVKEKRENVRALNRTN